MADIKGFLIDLGGVYQGNEPIAGSIEAITRLRLAGIPFRFLTDTTSRSKRSILKRLLDIGLHAETREIFTPAEAARAFIIEHDLSPHYLLSPALQDDFSGYPGAPRERLSSAMPATALHTAT